MKNILITGITIIITLAAAEGIVRLVIPRPVTYESQIEKFIKKPERMFDSNIDINFPTTGLYEGASTVRFRTGPKRFIEPEPRRPARFNVLFLGGSTTESFYVPEEKRWVALLNRKGLIATYNAGQSGANILDKYYTYKYLTEEKKMKFDLVVLMTVINDFSWMRRLEKYGGQLALQGYLSTLKKWHTADYIEKRTIIDVITDTSLLCNIVYRIGKKILINYTSDGTTDVVRYYRSEIRESLKKAKNRRITFKECPSINTEIARYASIERTNMALLKNIVESNGGRLLAMSESTSYGAPPESFKEDFRLCLECKEGGLYTLEESKKLSAMINENYISAARSQGMEIFDLAGAMHNYTNGKNGGLYQYDSVHYTPLGCKKVAELVKPKIEALLFAK